MVQQEHRFKDEWLVRLLGRVPGLTGAQLAQWREQGKPYLSQTVVDSGIIGWDVLSGLLREAFRIDFVDLKVRHFERPAIGMIPEKMIRQLRVLPIKDDGKYLDLAMANPLDDHAIQVVEWASTRAVRAYFCPPTQLEEAIAEVLSPETVMFNLLERLDAPMFVEVLNSGAADSVPAAATQVPAPVVKLVNAIIANAVRMRASDIHIEHEDTSTLVRCRVDGILRNVMVIPRYIGVGPLVSRIKIMAGLDVADRMRPQDGRAKLRVGDGEIGLRVSTLPTRVGEKVVIRILNQKSVEVSLGTLGFVPTIRERFEGLMSREQGMILVTGPTGSGKTTTLYASLNAMRSEGVNIVTVEDPVEYKLEGVNQVQVSEKQGLTFPAVLRSVLRQDPDVVLVGEIRDDETAAVAFQAALTGHLVLSTLHTNDTVSAVTRLVDLGVEPFKVAAGLIGVTAQRLVRRLCVHCSAPAPLAREHVAIRKAQRALAFTEKQLMGAGCQACGFTGYLGRVPLIEFLFITEEIRACIAQGGSSNEIRGAAVASRGLHLIEGDAAWHVAMGATSAEEVLAHLDAARLERLGIERADVRTTSSGISSPESLAAPQARDSVSPPAPAPPIARRAPTVVHPAAPAAANDIAPGAFVTLAIAGVGDRFGLQAVLEAAGYVVESAADGAATLGTLAKRTSDVLVVEADLPVLDAREVIRTARTTIGLLDLPALVLLPEARAAEAARFAGDFIDVAVGNLHGPSIIARMEALLARARGFSEVSDVMRPLIPTNEEERVADLYETGLLDTAPEERFDKITRMAQKLFNVPIALVSLVDSERQWFKSNQGLEWAETHRDRSFCAHAINYTGAFVVPDAALDPRFAENPCVTSDPHIRFYAGYPIAGPRGQPIGTLCIIDEKPREVTADEMDSLRDLAQLVEKEIGSR